MYSDDLKRTAGFTLIELSIVLVIIGLIVGGVLVGRDLISAAAVRAQISQIEKYQTAVNTFKGKFNYLPGDIALAEASRFGIPVGAGCAGGVAQRDGNGLLDAFNDITQHSASALSHDEPALFWEDLSSLALIDGTYSLGSCYGFTPTITQTPLLMPIAKINSNASIYVYVYNSKNWFGISRITSWPSFYMLSSPALTVSQAYAIDKKMDDGIPMSGRIMANFAAGVGVSNCPQLLFAYDTCTSANTATSGGTATSCYDTTTGSYSIGQNNGAGVNCGISFQFQ